MAKFPARQRALACLVLLDIVLKAAARGLLRGKPAIAAPGTPFGLGYAENASGFGFDQSRLLARYGVAADDAFVLCSLAAFLALAAVVHFWHRLGWRPWIKTAAGAAAYLAVSAAALSAMAFLRVDLPPYLRSVLRAAGPLSIALVLYAETERPYYSLLSLLFMAGTLGNCLSMLLPPFVVVDYLGIYRSSIRGFVYANLADAYLCAAMAMIVLIPAYLLIRRLHGRKP